MLQFLFTRGFQRKNWMVTNFRRLGTSKHRWKCKLNIKLLLNTWHIGRINKSVKYCWDLTLNVWVIGLYIYKVFCFSWVFYLNAHFYKLIDFLFKGSHAEVLYFILYMLILRILGDGSGFFLFIWIAIKRKSLIFNKCINNIKTAWITLNILLLLSAFY